MAIYIFFARLSYVNIGNTSSDSKEIKTGIPQGTVLGPLLLNIYINSLCNLNIQDRILAYAHDTKIIFCGDTWEETRTSIINWNQQSKKLFRLS